jgi:hypothetical protein
MATNVATTAYPLDFQWQIKTLETIDNYEEYKKTNL